MPDATGLELLAHELSAVNDSTVVKTTYHQGRAEIQVSPASVRDVLTRVKERGYSFMSSLHGVDYYPEEPRLGVIYEMLDMDRLDRLAIKVRVPLDDPKVESVVDLFPTADHQEREVYDMFGVEFIGHPDLRRILMPEDYEGHPQRRDFPIGGEEIIFTNTENTVPRWFE